MASGCRPYNEVRFKLAKFQHLELILRENKLKYTKLILNVADSETNVGIELGNQLPRAKIINIRDCSPMAIVTAPVLLFELTRSGLFDESGVRC